MMDKQLIYREDALEIVRRTSGDYAAAFAEISRLPAVDSDGFCSSGRQENRRDKNDKGQT